MGLPRGSCLGPYEIIGPLGAGGMGEVYRGRDPRLGREVAIKILPAAMASDADRLHRFEQEARATGSLDHPNILAVHDFGSHEGAPYLVCELLDGETLRERLRRGPLPPRKATEIAVQVARGLAAAHAKGITHRDIKPENLFLTRDGGVKILDFGLAKLALSRVRVTGDTATEMVPGETVPGVVLGTMGYMAPEQVRAQAVDHRSDIFALGAILFEMLSGQRAFAGATPADTMSAILSAEPPELVRISSAIPPALDRIVRHCLEKDPADRFQAARDLEFDLVALSVVSVQAPALPGHARHRALIQVLGLVLACAAVATAAFFLGRLAATPTPMTFQQLTFRKGYIFSARFSRDGQTIVYGAAWSAMPVQVQMTRLNSVESRDLDLPSADVLAITAKDEMAIMLSRRFVRPWEMTGTLARAPLAGGTPREILEEVGDADLSSDGAAFAVVRRVDGRQRLEYPTGTVLATATATFNSVRVSPDGATVAYLDHPVEADDRGFVAVAERGGKARRLSEEWSGLAGLAWHPKTGEIWFGATRAGENYGLYAVDMAGRTRSILGAPADLRILDISSSGRILMARDIRRSAVVYLRSDPPAEQDLSWFQDDDVGGLSADGGSVAFYTFGPGSGHNYAAYVGKTDGSGHIRLGEGGAFGITPDGKWVLGQVPHTSNRVTLWPTGAGEPRHFELAGFERAWFGDHCSFSSDGALVAFRGGPPGRAEGVHVLDVRTGSVRKVTDQPASLCLISPDGAQVAALDLSGRLALHPLSGGSPRTVPGLNPGEEVVEWDAGGRHMFIWDQRFPARVWRLDIATGERTLWREISSSDLAGVYWGRILMTQDGRSIAYRSRQLLSDLYVVDNLR